MTLRELQYLIVLNQTRHFGQAAEACFVTQPTLSTQIRKLEDELGVQLFERNQRHVIPTPICQSITERAQHILNEVEQIRETARQACDPEAGTLRLGVFPTLAPYLLPHVVPGLRDRFPRLQMLLTEEKTDTLIEQLEKGELDCAVLAEPVEQHTLTHAPLFEEPFMVALPDDDKLTRKKALSIQDLADRNVLLLDEGHCLRQQALDVCQLAEAHERSDFRATSLETLRQMVAAGVGMTLLPMLSVKPPIASQERIQLRPFTTNGPSRRLSLYWRKTAARSDFYQQIAAHISDLPDDLLNWSQ